MACTASTLSRSLVRGTKNAPGQNSTDPQQKTTSHKCSTYRLPLKRTDLLGDICTESDRQYNAVQKSTVR